MQGPDGGAGPEADDLSGLRPEQNVFELQVYGAMLESKVQRKNDKGEPQPISTFVAVDFFEHPTQLSLVTGGLSPAFDTCFQFVLDLATAAAAEQLVEYLRDTSLRVDLFQQIGYNTEPVAAAHLPLRRLLQDLQSGQGLQRQPRYADIVTKDGDVLGKLRYSVRMLRALPDGALPTASRVQVARPKEPLVGMAAIRDAIDRAELQPAGGLASSVQIIVNRLEGIPHAPSGYPPKSRVFVTFPGRVLGRCPFACPSPLLLACPHGTDSRHAPGV